MNNYPMITIKHWWPVIVWMSLIFFFSTDLFSGTNTTSFLQPILSSLLPDVSADQIETIHLIVRKLGHWGEYFILAILNIRGLHAELPAQSRIRRAASAIAIAAIYAASDEWHQSFVPSRSASVVDVVIDCVGATCGAFWSAWHRRD